MRKFPFISYHTATCCHLCAGRTLCPLRAEGPGHCRAARGSGCSPTWGSNDPTRSFHLGGPAGLVACPDFLPQALALDLRQGSPFCMNIHTGCVPWWAPVFRGPPPLQPLFPAGC